MSGDRPTSRGGVCPDSRVSTVKATTQTHGDAKKCTIRYDVFNYLKYTGPKLTGCRLLSLHVQCTYIDGIINGM